MTRVFSNLTALKAAVGTDLGHSAWLEIYQALIERFAEATGDFQWIHIDAERANDGPYGRTIAQGRRNPRRHYLQGGDRTASGRNPTMPEGQSAGLG